MNPRSTMIPRGPDRSSADPSAASSGRPVPPAPRRLLPALAVALLFVAVPLAGCTSGSEGGGSGGGGANPFDPDPYDTWTHTAGGQGLADESGRLDVPTAKVRATMAVGGQATVHLFVMDEDGDLVLRMDCTGSGGCSKTRTSETGDPGEWTIELKGLFSGGVAVTVRPTR